MLALCVKVNDELVCTAGAPSDGVLGIHLTWVDVSRWSRGHFLFCVGGLDSATSEHLRWQVPSLDVGDRVSVRVVDTDAIDPPSERYQSTSENYTVWLWRQYLRQARQELSELRANPRAWVTELRSTVVKTIREAVASHEALAFRVTHDGQDVCMAGTRHPCVMTAHVSAVQQWGAAAERRISLDVSALDVRRREHIQWNTPQISGGAMVAFEVLATDRWDPPSARWRAE
jgi:hypothetical protein